MKHLKNLNIVITAGASGVGSKMAVELSKHGSCVTICDKDLAALERFSCNHPKIDCHNVDVSNESQIEKFFSMVGKKAGSINALINNAGISGPSAKLEDTSFQDWKETIDTNLDGVFLATKSAIPLLKKNGGSVINIGSTSSFLGTPLRSAYSASKWGLIGLTKTWAMEYGKNNIRFNAICPSSINGKRIEDVIKKEAEYRNTSTDKIKSSYLNQTSLKTFIESEEVVGMIIYLLSPLAKKITGQMLVIDGHTETLSMMETD